MNFFPTLMKLVQSLTQLHTLFSSPTVKFLLSSYIQKLSEPNYSLIPLKFSVLAREVAVFEKERSSCSSFLRINSSYFCFNSSIVVVFSLSLVLDVIPILCRQDVGQTYVINTLLESFSFYFSRHLKWMFAKSRSIAVYSFFPGIAVDVSTSLQSQ